MPKSLKRLVPHDIITVQYSPPLHKQNVDEILRIYEEEFGKLSTRFFTEAPWPRAELIAPLVKGGVFITVSTCRVILFRYRRDVPGSL